MMMLNKCSECISSFNTQYLILIRSEVQHSHDQPQAWSSINQPLLPPSLPHSLKIYHITQPSFKAIIDLKPQKLETDCCHLANTTD